MSLGADHAATIIAAAGDRRRAPSQDHHLAADRNGQAGNSQAHPATRTLILNREPQPATTATRRGLYLRRRIADSVLLPVPRFAICR